MKLLGRPTAQAYKAPTIVPLLISREGPDDHRVHLSPLRQLRGGLGPRGQQQQGVGACAAQQAGARLVPRGGRVRHGLSPPPAEDAAGVLGPGVQADGGREASPEAKKRNVYTV